jgi:rod shape-determining protein MreB and related proteins
MDVDVGEATVTVYVRREGVVVHEPSLGTSAGPEAVIPDLIRRVRGLRRLFKPEVMICVSPDLSSDLRRAVTEAAVAAGTRQAWLVGQPLAAAIGAGLPIEKSGGVLVCDIGAGHTQVAVMCGSGTLAAGTLPVGGAALGRAIAGFLGRRPSVEVDERGAEDLKLAAGWALPVDSPLSGRLGPCEVTSSDLAAAMEPPLRRVAEGTSEVLREAPAHLLGGLRRRGLTLTGGGARLRGIDRFLSLRLGVPVRVAAEPETYVARGAGLAPDRLEVLRHNRSCLR